MCCEYRVFLVKPFAVMVVDDRPVVHAAIVTILDGESDFSAVCDASNGHQTTRAMHLDMSEVGLIDLSMPRFSAVFSTRTGA
jgi:DNA-binding NarL/FixJ family response regulator